jgi:hypothetical protein
MSMRAPGAIEEYILRGWLPGQPFITPTSKVTAIGSCFARHIIRYLNRRSYTILTARRGKAHIISMGEGLVNTFALRGQFDWAFRGITPTQELWHGWSAEAYGHDEETRLATRAMFEKTDVFILVLGLSEIWYDEPTGEVFWRAVPVTAYDPERHKFRVASVAENTENLRVIYDTVREFRPKARILLMLSPMPLAATFRPISPIAANSVSKASLRVAIDELHRDVRHEERLFYWPSYEIVMDGFGEGRWRPDGRHVHDDVLAYTMQLFEKHYCLGSAPDRPLEEARLTAMETARELPADAVAAARSGDRAAVAAWVAANLDADDRETAELLAHAADAIRDAVAH